MSEKITKSRQGQSGADISEFVNPFPGLRPFGVEEAHLFFGREGQSDELLIKLAENKFVGVLGASGSGKSSLMYCGLIPTLHGGFMTQAGSTWRIVVARPGGGPVDNLAEALLTKDKIYNELDEEERLIRKTIMATVLRSSSLGLVEAVKQIRASENENVLILIDQFEELFRFKKLESNISDLDESSAFVNLLLEAVHQFDQPIYVALTMRSDFIGDCAQYPDLTQMINDSHYLIPQMTRDQKRIAIEGPVAVGGGKIAPRLIQQLLNDVGDSPDQLPILQHALMRTWQYWVDHRKEDEPMDINHYTAIGTLKEALSQHANEAYDSLNKREKEICEVMFKALTERRDNSGIRRPTPVGTIAAIAGVSEDEVVRVVNKFREPGRSLLMPPFGIRLETETVVDISHESLMRIWTRLKAWLDEESRSSEMYLKLAEAAERYQEGKAGLWKMPDLQLALNWQEENKPTLVWGQRYDPAFERTMVFLETSKKAYDTEQLNKELLQKRQLRRSRRIAFVSAAAAIIGLGLVIFSFIKANEAEKQTVLAQEAAQRAEKAQEQAQQSAAKAIEEAARADQAAKEAEKQAAIAREQADIAEQEKQNAQEAQRRAEASQREALAAKEEADKQREEADAQRTAALEAQAAAEMARLAADRLRYQAIAQSMAIKAVGVRDTELKALVAKQGYDFYQEYKDEGKDYNGDIYAGVFSALKGLEGDSLNLWVGHTKSVRSVAYNSDGSKMYSAGADGKILAWDMTNDNRNFTEVYAQPDVNRVVGISPDEKYLAIGVGSGTDEQGVLLYNIQSPAEAPITVAGHGGEVFDLVFLPDGKGFVSTGADGTIKLSNFTTTKTIGTFKQRMKSLAVSPDGKILAGGNEEGNVLLWDLTSTDQEPRTIYVRQDDQNTSNPVSAVEFNRDGTILAFGDEQGSVVLYDMIQETEIRTLTNHATRVTDIEFSHNNQLLATSSTDGTADIWNMQNLNDLPTVLSGHNDWVWGVSFDPDNEHLVTAGRDGNVRLWPTKADEYAARLCGHVGVDRNMYETEWAQYVGEDIEYKITCEEYGKSSEQ